MSSVCSAACAHLLQLHPEAHILLTQLRHDPPQRLPAAGGQMGQLVVFLLRPGRGKERRPLGEEFPPDPLIALCRPLPPCLHDVLGWGKAQRRAVQGPSMAVQHLKEPCLGRIPHVHRSLLQVIDDPQQLHFKEI